MKTCAFTGHPQITLECAIPYERQAVWYAREAGKPVWIIRPDTLEVQ